MLPCHCLPALERILLIAGRGHGQCRMVRFTFRPSRRLRALCSMRRNTADSAMRKFCSFEIRRLHRQEIRSWKNSRLRQSLGRVSHWKALRNMIHTTAGRAYASQPPLDEFADALETIFSGNEFFPDRPAALTEANWTLDELKRACARLKVNKACDEKGLAAELQHAPDQFLVELLRVFNGILQHGSSPTGWKKTLFTMCPKKTRAKLVTDFRPIANIRFQGVCLHDPRTSGAVIGKLSARITTWVSVRPKDGRTRFDNKIHFGQEQSSWIAIVDHQLGFIENLRYSKLGNFVGSFASTKYFRAVDLDFAVPLKQSNRCRSRWCW